MVEFNIQDQSQISEIRRIALGKLSKLNADSTYTGKISIILTELSTNLVKHTTSGGKILFKVNDEDNYTLILSIDKGTGISNITDSLTDGFSTSGTMGGGLGAVKRMSHFFDIYSSSDGTIVLSIVYFNKQSQSGHHFESFGSVHIAKPGESVSGDNFAFKDINKNKMFIVADGLGHGYNAAEASSEAINGFQRYDKEIISDLLQDINGRLRALRGAAVSIASINPDSSVLRYAGIGNVNSVIVYPDLSSKTLISNNGIVGHDIRRIVEYQYQWRNNSLLIMHSDGLTNRWNLSKYPGIINKSPYIIAALLFRDYSRGNDDSTVMVYKYNVTV